MAFHTPTCPNLEKLFIVSKLPAVIKSVDNSAVIEEIQKTFFGYRTEIHFSLPE
jgi:hypothetical protein